MGEWNICEAVSPTFISPYKETTTTVSVRFISTAKTEKTSWKTFQDIWLYIFEITIITSQFWNVKLYYFVTLKDMNNKLLYPGSRLIPLRNEPILQIWVTGNIFKDISSKSSKRIMQYHEHWRSRETERKNNHSK